MTRASPYDLVEGSPACCGRACDFERCEHGIELTFGGPIWVGGEQEGHRSC